jgi:hypothetical protein
MVRLPAVGGIRFLTPTNLDSGRRTIGRGEVHRGKAAFSSGVQVPPAKRSRGSNRSSHAGNEMAEAFDSISRAGDSASGGERRMINPAADGRQEVLRIVAAIDARV